MSRRAGVAIAAACVAAAAGTAAAHPGAGGSRRITSASLHYAITLPAAWRAAPVAPPLVAAFARKAPRQRLILVRVRYPTRPAWRGDHRFFDEVEQGALGGRRPGHVHRRRFKVHGVPVMDLRFARRGDAGREAVAMRFIFYRRYTLALAIATPRRARRARRQARRVVASFRPYFATAASR